MSGSILQRMEDTAKRVELVSQLPNRARVVPETLASRRADVHISPTICLQEPINAASH